MKKKTIYLFCAACLAWSCSNDPTNEPDRTAGFSPGEPVPIKLELQMTDYAAPTPRISRNVRAAASGTRSGLVDVEISAIEPAPGTRAAGGEIFTIPDDQKIFRLDILQFDGTGKDAQLIGKQVLSREDGDLSKYIFKDLTFISTTGTEKNRVAVLGNAPASLSAGLQVKTSSAAGTTYESLLQEKVSRTEENASAFPLIKWSSADVPAFSGTTTTTIATGSQIGVELMRTIARVNFEFLMSEAMIAAYSDWDIVMNGIPPASFYNPQAYQAPFPEKQVADPYYSRVLGVGLKSPKDPAAPLLKTGFYLPVNLQHSVPGTTVPNRYPHAPVMATSLQLLGKKIENGTVTQTVVYMIPLGSNFTDDYSIRPNNAINYRITLASDSPDDASVLKFIAGKFAGKFRKFTNPADNTDCWGFEDDLEVWPTDVEYMRYPSDSGEDFTGTGTWMPFLSTVIAGLDPTITTITDKTDGFTNTYNLCKRAEGWSAFTAAYMCLRQLNGLPQPPQRIEDMQPNAWFLPAINQLIAIYVAGGSQVSSMQSYYWSSSIDNRSATANPISVYKIGSNGLLAQQPTAVNDGTHMTYTKAAVRGCRIPPPGESEPKISH